MLTINQQIMREIHNEQRALDSSLDGFVIFEQLRDVDFLDQETKTLLWHISKFDKTFFGEGILEESKEYQEDDAEIEELYDLLIRAFITATIRYKQPEYHSQRAFDILVESIDDLFNVIGGYEFPEENIINLLAGLIECDTMASWLLVSWLD